MFYAKSVPKESIKQHTNRLLKNLNILKEMPQNDIYEERIWKLLEIVCIYHDLGKVYTPFQNKILEKLGKRRIPTKFEYNWIKHEQLSPMFVPVNSLKLTKDEKILVYQAIFYHHERISDNIDCSLVIKIIEDDIKPNLDKIKKELQIEVENLSSFYLKYVGNGKRIMQGDKLYRDYCLIKGLLNRLDHCSSAHVNVEDDDMKNITIEEIFSIVFKYKGYEKIYSSLANSNVVISELPYYSPEIFAIVFKVLQMIKEIGGNVIVMPSVFYKFDELCMKGEMDKDKFLNSLENGLRVLDDIVDYNIDKSKVKEVFESFKY